LGKEKQDGYMPRSKDRSRSEREKLREMKIKEKIEYIWEYYKYHIVGTVIALAILGSLLNTWIFNPQPDVGLFIAWNAGFADQDRLDDLRDTFNEHMTFQTEGEVADVSRFFTATDDPQMHMAHIQRLVAMITAGQIDAFIVDSELFAEYSYIGYIVPLDQLLSLVESINPDVHAIIMNEATFALHSDHDEVVTERLMGIRLADSPLLLELGIINHDWYWMDWYFGISVTTGNLTNIAHALIMMFE